MPLTAHCSSHPTRCLFLVLNIFIREWAIVAVGLGLCGEDVIRLLLQDFRKIGVGGRVDDVCDCDSDITACQQHIHAVVHSAQADGVVFIIQEGLDFFAEFKSNTAAVAAAASASGALLFEGSWSHVFDSVTSYLNSQSSISKSC